MNVVLQQLLGVVTLADAFKIQRRILKDFHRRASEVIDGVCSLRDYEQEDLSVGRNMFSALFLAAQRCAGLASDRRMFYGLINQCMRAWVTACDNLLDEELKIVIPFDLPKGGHRFQSVLTIMTTDRVLSGLLAEEVAAGRISPEKADTVSRLTLHALVPSGIQEHEEELGARIILRPDDLLEKIHVPKTGLLFEAPIKVPELLGDVDSEAASKAKEGLCAFGLACQILDDIVDLEDDVRSSHHNFVLSQAVYSDINIRPDIVAYADIELEGLNLKEAMEVAHGRSLELFKSARSCLDSIGMCFSDKGWQVLVAGIMTRLNVPEEVTGLVEVTL
jgi:hypothetical protein